MIVLILATFAFGGDTVRDIIGINEGVAVPERALATLTTAAINDEFDRDIALIKSLGVSHVRVHSGRYPFSNWHDQTNTGRSDGNALDNYLTKLTQAGITPLLMIGPWPGNHTANYTDTYLPTDQRGYLDWVRNIVERYDGDGIDDIPNATVKITVWEIDNEPDIHYAGSLRNGNTPFESPNEFGTLVKITASAIHTADRTATVIHGGIFNPARQDGGDYLRALWSDPDFARATDGINLHRYPNGPGVNAIWEAVTLGQSIAPNTPVWLTEVSTSSKDRGGRASQTTQANDLITLILGGLERGITRIYWHSLVESPNYYDTRRRSPLTKGRHLFVGDQGQTTPWFGLSRWTTPKPKLAALALTNFLDRYGDVPQTSVGQVSAGKLTIGDDTLLYGPAGAFAIRAPNGAIVHQLIPDKTGNFTRQPLSADGRGLVTVHKTNSPVAVKILE